MVSLRVVENPPYEEWGSLVERPSTDVTGFRRDVIPIIDEVLKEGDAAVSRYTAEFDGIDLGPDEFRVSEDEVEKAYDLVNDDVLKALETSVERVREFHERAYPGVGKDLWSLRVGGAECGVLVRPVEKVACYVPGGRASYPSTAVMTVVPASVAGCNEVVVITPPSKDDPLLVPAEILVAADLSGADVVFRVGGVQAVAGVAAGTETLPEVDKIVGPGNVYVTCAKLEVYARGLVDVDMPAGPSEVLVVADSSADPDELALDVMAQAEHDPMSVSVLVCSDGYVARETVRRLEENLKDAPRKEVLKESLRNSLVVVFDDLDTCLDFANEFAPEHLHLYVERPEELLKKVRSAGAVFLGGETTVPFGDYVTGPNHVLPTGGLAKARGALSTLDFVKFIPFQRVKPEALDELARVVETLAEVEGLPNHARAVRVRRPRGEDDA